MPPRKTKDRSALQARPSRVTKPRENGIIPTPTLLSALTEAASVNATGTDGVQNVNTTSNNTGVLVPGLPDVDGAPPAWAEDRPSLASTIPWISIFQGGMYRKNGVCWGFLIDGDCGVRSYIDDEIVITRIGGGSEKCSDGSLVLKKDQDEASSFVKCIKNSMESRIAVGMVIGKPSHSSPRTSSNSVAGSKTAYLLKRKLPYRFNIMDFFRVADIWKEKLNGKIAFRVRFEKLDLSKKSWWAERGAPLPVPHAQRITQPEVKKCSVCHVGSKQVYKEGWICLNQQCSDFWKLNGSEPPTDLTLHDKFLEYRCPYDPAIQPPSSLVPDLLSTIDETDGHAFASRRTLKGIVCPSCKKCIPRRFWNGWACSVNNNADGGKELKPAECSFSKSLTISALSLHEVIDNNEPSSNKRSSSSNPEFLAPQIDDETHYPYRVLTYSLGDEGSIMHFVSNRAINERPGGPNDLLSGLQVPRLDLRRYPMGQAVVTGTLQSQFAVNYGRPYAFVVSVDSLGFEGAPESILRALGRLTWAAQKSVHHKDETILDPNEMLVLGYLEGQKIGYHDDGESTVGPTIASLSLGAKATMHVRMKFKYYHGSTLGGRKKGTPTPIDDDPVLEYCENYNERQRLKEQLSNGLLTKDAYNEAWLESYSKFKESEKDRVAPPDLIQMELNHGDMVVMHGKGVQKYYEHGVDMDKNARLRFALTARHVKMEFVKPEDLPKGKFELKEHQKYEGN
ncbi:hypothetical protein BJX76DRAFT_327716 [Aspergillus varians]